MPRRPRTLAAVASLVLCVATVALWTHSYWWQHAIMHCRVGDGEFRVSAIQMMPGEIDLLTGTYLSGGFQPVTPGWQYHETDKDQLSLREFGSVLPGKRASGWLVGFGFFVAGGNGFEFHAVAIPHWFLALLFAVLPTLRVRGALRSHNRHEGLCPICGYDLRATPARCPECGAVPAAAAAR